MIRTSPNSLLPLVNGVGSSRSSSVASGGSYGHLVRWVPTRSFADESRWEMRFLQFRTLVSNHTDHNAVMIGILCFTVVSNPQLWITCRWPSSRRSLYDTANVLSTDKPFAFSGCCSLLYGKQVKNCWVLCLLQRIYWFAVRKFKSEYFVACYWVADKKEIRKRRNMLWTTNYPGDERRRFLLVSTQALRDLFSGQRQDVFLLFPK